MTVASLVLLVGLGLSADAAGGGPTSPPRALGSPAEATENCRRSHGGGALSGRVAVTVSVGADGRVTGAASAPGTPAPLAAAAQCVAVTQRFEPAQADGRPVPGTATVEVGFPVPPALRQDLGRAVEYCQPAIQPLVKLNNAATEGTLDLLVMVGRDGKVIDTRLPEGTLPWMEAAADCLAERLDFFPARLGLEAVEAWALVPVRFNLARDAQGQVRLEPPALRSEANRIVEIYRACYPAGRRDEALIHYRITVTAGGRVRKAEPVTTGGDAALAAAGACILKKLVFTPARRNGVNVESTVGWPIRVRPPET